MKQSLKGKILVLVFVVGIVANMFSPYTLVEAFADSNIPSASQSDANQEDLLPPSANPENDEDFENPEITTQLQENPDNTDLSVNNISDEVTDGAHTQVNTIYLTDTGNSANLVDIGLTIEKPLEEYYPGQIITLAGNWSLPNDSEYVLFQNGDSFSIIFPEGLTPEFSTIKMGEMGSAVREGNMVTFTFNENVEQLIDRHGGFRLRFSVNPPDEYGKTDLPLMFYDNEGRVILDETIVVNHVPSGTSNSELFTKGAFSKRYGDTVEWYIRINLSGNLDSPQLVTVEDTILDNHQLVEDSFKIIRRNGLNNEGLNDTDRIVKTIDPDKQGFTLHDIPLDIVSIHQQPTFVWYDISYTTVYTGNQTGGDIKLGNYAELLTNNGVLKPQSSPDDGIVWADFDTGGWAIGNEKTTFSLKKVDSITKQPLAGVKFKLSHKLESAGFTPIEFETDTDGKYTHKQHINSGLYVLEELKAPEGYQLMEPKEIYIKPNNGMPFEVVVENNLQPITIQGNKVWINEKGDEVSPTSSVVIKLLADTNEFRRVVLPVGTTKFSFANLPVKNSDGTDIVYAIEESVGEYTTKIVETSPNNYVVTNTVKTPPVVPPAKEIGLTIEKVDSANHSLKLAGAVFQLEGLSENAKADSSPRQFTSNAKGEIKVGNLAEGRYALREISPPNGYQLNSSEIIIEVRHNADNTIDLVADGVVLKDGLLVVTNTKKVAPPPDEVDSPSPKPPTKPPTSSGSNRPSGSYRPSTPDVPDSSSVPKVKTVGKGVKADSPANHPDNVNYNPSTGGLPYPTNGRVVENKDSGLSPSVAIIIALAITALVLFRNKLKSITKLFQR